MIKNILFHFQKKILLIRYKSREQNITKLFENRREFLLKILNVPFNLFYKFAYEKLFYKLMPYSHIKILLKHKYILSLKKFYFSNLDDIDYTILSLKSKIKFSKDEIDFLEKVNQNYLPKIDHKTSIILKNYIYPEYNLKFQFQREIFSCVFKNIEFFGASGILVQNGQVLIESACSLLRFCFYKMFYLLMPRKRKMKGVYTSIMFWDEVYNYYHFLTDNLPRLYTILQINEPEINLIVPKNYRNFYLNIIKLFLDERFNIIYINPDEVWEVEKFYFASFYSNDIPTCSGYISKECLDFIKEKIVKSLNIKRKIQRKRIYISRNKTKKRRLLNEKDILNILKKYNFEKIYVEDLAFKEQVELFHSAEIVVAPTGAGLANIIFSGNLMVLELFPPNFINQHYFFLCKTLKFHRRYIIGYEEFDNQDFLVDSTELENLVKEMINDLN